MDHHEAARYFERRQAEAKAAVAEYSRLIGARILGVCTEDDGDQIFPGLRLRLRDGTIVTAWIHCDPEGNGPGHLLIEAD